MNKKILFLNVLLGLFWEANAQFKFPVKIEPQWSAQTVWVPASPLKHQVVFKGGVDTVQTTPTYGNPATQTLAKQWNDFIGFIKDTTAGGIGWVVVNHEMIQKNDNIGDGGGMTSFKVKKNKEGQLEVMETELADGRKGKFFNVDFANTVGETGMNCGGINSIEFGRIWTAEEWMQSSNAGIFANGGGFTDTSDFIIGTTTPAGFEDFNGKQIKRFNNLNWMVEIDPKQGKAIRKQYNWGRAGWEAGVLMPNNKTVYLFEDGSPGIFAKFEATTAGDFTKGTLFVYKHDVPSKWIAIENDLDTLSNLNSVAIRRGATMFNRLEWGSIANGKLYITETGRDAFTWNSGEAALGVVNEGIAEAYKVRYKIITGNDFTGTLQDAADSVRAGKFNDYYGRVLEFDPNTNNIRLYLEGGPYTATSASATLPMYPSIHLSNPDGLATFKIGNKEYLMVQEDLNGRTFNRMPAGFTSSASTICEMFMLDASITNPTFNDLIRVTACAPGAEITGAIQIDEDMLLVNSQHPNGQNMFPYNNSLTYSISGFTPSTLSQQNVFKTNKGLSIYPNPASREINLSKTSDVAIYSITGQRLAVYRDASKIDISTYEPGTYFIQTNEGETIKLIIAD